jgi:hypothetical protein
MKLSAAGLACALLLVGITGPEPQWEMTAASDVQAHQTKTGIDIGASVDLQNACWEATISVVPESVAPVEFLVVARTKPEDVGKMCTMAVVPTTVHAVFPINQQAVTVHATNQTFNVRVVQ